MMKFRFTFFVVWVVFSLKSQLIPVGIPGLPGAVFHINIQKQVQLASGDVKPLISLQKIFVKYDYEFMAVCTFTSENDYLQDIQKKFGEGKATDRIDEWKALPKTVLQPKFEEFFNKHSYETNLHVYHDSIGTQATLIVKVLREDPHYHREPESIPPYIVLECTFLDAEGYFIARFNLTASGSHESNVANRLGECYSIAGKMLARELKKRIIKAKSQN